LTLRASSFFSDLILVILLTRLAPEGATRG
jgi:hypothetical protein